MPPDLTTAPAVTTVPKRPGLFATFQKLWPYLWPQGRADLQRRVFLAFALLLIATTLLSLAVWRYRKTV